MALLQVGEKEESDNQVMNKFSQNLKNNLNGSKHTPNADDDPPHRKQYFSRLRRSVNPTATSGPKVRVTGIAEPARLLLS